MSILFLVSVEKISEHIHKYVLIKFLSENNTEIFLTKRNELLHSQP